MVWNACGIGNLVLELADSDVANQDIELLGVKPTDIVDVDEFRIPPPPRMDACGC